jgi:hypothetical protein
MSAPIRTHTPLELAHAGAVCANSGPKGPVKLAQQPPSLPELARFLAHELAHWRKTRRTA